MFMWLIGKKVRHEQFNCSYTCISKNDNVCIV